MLKKSLFYISHPRRLMDVCSNLRHAEKIRAANRKSDALHNASVSVDRDHIVFIRDAFYQYNQHFLHWISRHHPAISRLIRLERVPGRRVSLNHVKLLVPWFQDPLKETDPRVYQRVLSVEQKANSSGIPVINPVERLSRSVKSRALEMIRSSSIRTARTIEISPNISFNHEEAGLDFPFFIREDHHHGGAMAFIDSPQALAAVDWTTFHKPIAMEFIDVRNDDGYCRKFRKLVVGDTCFPRHLLVSRDWNLRLKVRISDEWALKEEREFLNASGGPEDARLIAAKNALGFDIVAFDYSFDAGGQLVIWEPNPFPIYWSAHHEPYYTDNDRLALNKIYPGLLRYYFQRAGMEDSGLSS